MTVINLRRRAANLVAASSTVTDIETGGAHGLRVDVVAHGTSPPGITELRRALVATELRCAAALRQLDRMRHRDALLQRQAASLTEAVANAQRFAYHDELTGLPNRRSLLDHFNLAAALALRHDQQVALLFLDLDRFKHVNDTLGHAVGDKLLQRVAARLVASLRASDTACRYGGDEFVVLLPELSGKDGAVAAADNIRAHLAPPYSIDGAQISVTISLGIAMHSTDADGFGALLEVADRAMYLAKDRGPAVPSISGETPVSRLGSDRASHCEA